MQLGVSIDYFLSEFCTVEGEWVTVDWNSGALKVYL
jgi:hypothetical protein